MDKQMIRDCLFEFCRFLVPIFAGLFLGLALGFGCGVAAGYNAFFELARIAGVL